CLAVAILRRLRYRRIKRSDSCGDSGINTINYTHNVANRHPSSVKSPTFVTGKTISMTKNAQILRLKFIEILLRERKERGASYEEIEEYLEEKFADKDLGEELKFSKKTFERDKKAIADILGFEISYSRKRNAY